ncbi:hypothetical protein [Nocardia salmonicida]|uniref:hypothetical protein n=1 Tax=Nocardia salmonicida TaxID=53431 RepID=UPI003F577D82
MQAVPPFARAICARMGAPAGAFEGYLEVQYETGDTEVIPDAVLKVSRGTKWVPAAPKQADVTATEPVA